MTVERVDVLVVTALQLEHRAIREHLRDVRTEVVTGLAADIGWHGDGIRCRVAIIETGAGSVDAAILTARAEDAFRPAVVAMVGIAGGVKDVAVGDVVASSKVYWIEGGRQGTVLHPRPEIAAVSPALMQTARAVAAEDQWLTRSTGAAGAWPGARRRPMALVAPIVVAEKVLIHRVCDVATLIRQSYGDAVAIDMEDFGALRAARSTERARVIAIRGISDLLSDKAATDAAGSQPLAAANAAAFLFELLSCLRLHDQRHLKPESKRTQQIPVLPQTSAVPHRRRHAVQAAWKGRRFQILALSITAALTATIGYRPHLIPRFPDLLNQRDTYVSITRSPSQSSPPSPGGKPIYLSELTPTASSGAWVTGARHLFGTKYEHSYISCPITECDMRTVQVISFDLKGGRYARLTGVLGVDDRNNSDRARFHIIADNGAEVLTDILGNGTVHHLNMPISGASTLRIEVYAVNVPGMSFVCGDCQLSPSTS